MNDRDAEEGMVRVICWIIGVIVGILMAMGLMSLVGCNSEINDSGIKRIYTKGIGLAYYNHRHFPGETTETMTEALEQMREVSIDVSACLDNAYGTNIGNMSGLAIPKVRKINFKSSPFLSIAGNIEKVTECFGMSSVVCNYMLLRDKEGNWMLERWAAETESLYRNEVFGYSNIYNRNIPSPEQYIAAKECISKYKE